MKKEQLKQIIKEEIHNIIKENWTPKNKDVLRNDIENTISIFKNTFPEVYFFPLSRFAAGSSSEIYLKIEHDPGVNVEEYIEKTFPLGGKTPNGRNVYYDKTNKVHFRIRPWDENETNIIFTRNIPKGRQV